MKSPKGQKRSPGGRKEQKVQKKQPAFSQKPPPIIVPFTNILPSTMKDHKSGEEILSPSDPCRTSSWQATAAQTRYPRGLLRLELLRLSDGEHVASGLYLHHYQSHIILLGTTVHEGRNLVHDALKNLLARPPSTRAKERFQALLTPQFTLTVCCFYDSVSAGHHDIAIL